MPYDKKIQRSEPGLIVLVLDDSGSMGQNLEGTSDQKCVWVERYSQHIMKELLARSTELSGDRVTVKPRYHVQAIIYGSQPRLWMPSLVDIEQALQAFTSNNYSFGLNGGAGGTDTDAALRMAYDAVSMAVADSRFASSFPPMVFHLTDGESHTDASATAELIKQLRTADGNVILVNAYIGSRTSLPYTDPNDFPGYLSEADVGISTDNLRLFNMSSVAPDTIVDNLIGDCIFPQLRRGARLFFDVRTRDMLKHVIQVVGSIGTQKARQYA